jgi:hypothetical protein
MEKYGSTEITQKKSGEMGQAKEAVFASLPRSGLLELEFSYIYSKTLHRNH